MFGVSLPSALTFLLAVVVFVQQPTWNKLCSNFSRDDCSSFEASFPQVCAETLPSLPSTSYKMHYTSINNVQTLQRTKLPRIW